MNVIRRDANEKFRILGTTEETGQSATKYAGQMKVFAEFSVIEIIRAAEHIGYWRQIRICLKGGNCNDV